MVCNALQNKSKSTPSREKRFSCRRLRVETDVAGITTVLLLTPPGRFRHDARKTPMHITFYGAAREVTGSMHLLTNDGDRVLFDCGNYLILLRLTALDLSFGHVNIPPYGICIVSSKGTRFLLLKREKPEPCRNRLILHPTCL